MMERLTALFDRQPRTAEAWLARMSRPRIGARDQAAFLKWLERDAAHLEQYQAAKADLAALESLRGAFAVDLAQLRRGPSRRAGGRWVMAGGLVAAGLTAVVFAAPFLTTAPVEVRRYESAPGQILDVVLTDGSRATLDAGSAIEVAMAGDARRVTLTRGAAYFDVVHDSAHPFQVAVGDRNVIVTGTRFTTALRHDRAEVSLLEGHVAIGRRDVRQPHALDDAVRMTAGQSADFSVGQPTVKLAEADVEVMSAWRERRLVFHDAPLSTVAGEVERYVGQPLVIADPRLARLRVTAVLPLEGDGALIDRMGQLLPVRAEKQADGRILIRAE
ncbi:transmembrane sensor [Brevundimonas nasdae]|uniref:FecR family protein n=1 Tax=Brevundimonas nasdae TaxID=172043 RepID=UPI0019126937|nr:FecR domain-containing protein [Brevundimonas nasdae]MBK6024910.1 FecR domain-containing protein [Brevundimonas nasdae]MDQ0451756.1 transmembrane sensor [Brevundimonas nasdae]